MPKKLRSRFARNERGSVAIIFAVALMPLTLAVGAAIDASRWFSGRRDTAAMIDTALLAGARMAQYDPDNKEAALAVAQKYYNTHKVNRKGESTDTVTFVLTDSGAAITFSGEARLKTVFLTLLGINDLQLTSPSKAAFQSTGSNGGSNIEIALALDVTGSMCDDGAGPCVSGTKLSGLKTAAKELVNIVLGNTASGLTSKIAVVPWATSIRLARTGDSAALASAVTNLPETLSAYVSECINYSGSGGGESGDTYTCNQYQTNYRSNLKLAPCVTDRYYASSNTFDTTDAPPGPGIWINAVSGTRYPLSADSSDTLPSSGRGLSAADPLVYYNHVSDGGCWDSMDSNVVLPLTSNQSDLTSRIDELQGYASTGGALGTAWAYYMLSPRWASIWPSASAPGSYSEVTAKNSSGAPVLRKVAVIMSDGDYNTWLGWKEQNQTDVSRVATAICDDMKKKGIEIFTVGFNLDALSSSKRTIAEDTLRACGSDISHFYATLDVDQLVMAFRDIALKVKPVRLTQ